MRTENTARVLNALIIILAPIAAFAQEAVPVGEPLVNVNRNLNYALVGMLVLQTVFILSLSGILRTMTGSGHWIRKATQGKKVIGVGLLVMLWSNDAIAQAYTGAEKSWRPDEIFWLLLAGNVVFFIILLVQINLLRGLTKVATGASEAELPVERNGPSWTDRVLARLTRQVSQEKEQDILMHHEYDGIRELDNVLPPWWLWLFYGSIAWSVVYLLNVHVIDIWPVQKEEYINEMQQATLDIAAYNATLAAAVDETNVVESMDPGMLANGKTLFTQYCTACHGPDAAGFETSVGPNLTDAHWLHGGGAKNIFRTIKQGVPEKGMISWKAQLKPTEIHALVSWIMSVQGTGGADQKAPQGDPWMEQPTMPDSTALPPDTVRVAAR